MKLPLVTIVIVTHNSARFIELCINSLLKAEYEQMEIVVVDNVSTDNTRKILSSFGDKIRLILSESNLGYASGCNLGFENSRGPYVFLLNPDTEVKKDFLKPLVTAAQKNHKIAACQPLVYLLKEKKRVNLTGKVTHFLGFDWIRDYLQTEPPEKGEITSFSGCGVLLRKKAVEKAEYFDPFYFMYYEDGDLSWRLRLLGYKILFIPESIIYHDYKYLPKEGYQSLKRKLYFNERNRLITIIKNYQLSTLALLFPAILAVEVGMILFSFFGGWGKEKLAGYISILRNIGYLLRERKIVQRHRKVGDRKIIESFERVLSFKFFENPAVRYMVNPSLNIYNRLVSRLI